MFSYKNPRVAFGFTLIELIVVIAIIGILTSIVLANLASARAGARDDIRKTDIKDLQVAVELYKAQNGVYPLGCKGANSWSGYGDTTFNCSTGVDYIQGLTPDYIAVLPIDNRFSPTVAGYLYRSNGADYKIMAFRSVESKRISSFQDDFARCPAVVATTPGCTPNPAADTYAVYSAGAINW